MPRLEFGFGFGYKGRSTDAMGIPITPPVNPPPVDPMPVAQSFVIPFNRPLLRAFSQAPSGGSTIRQMDNAISGYDDPEGFRAWLQFPEAPVGHSAWFADYDAGSTGTARTGPAANNPFTFAYIESSFAAANTRFRGPNINVIHAGFLAGTARSMRVIYNAYGDGFRNGSGDDFEGIILRGSENGSIRSGANLAGWTPEFSTADVNTFPIQYNTGTDDTPIDADDTLGAGQRAYGWAATDFVVLDTVNEVSIIPSFVTAGAGGAARHDLSIRELQFSWTGPSSGPSGNSGFSDGFDEGF